MNVIRCLSMTTIFLVDNLFVGVDVCCSVLRAFFGSIPVIEVPVQPFVFEFDGEIRIFER